MLRNDVYIWYNVQRNSCLW